MSAEAWVALGALMLTVVATACGATAWLSSRMTRMEGTLQGLCDRVMRLEVDLGVRSRGKGG